MLGELVITYPYKNGRIQTQTLGQPSMGRSMTSCRSAFRAKAQPSLARPIKGCKIFSFQSTTSNKAFPYVVAAGPLPAATEAGMELNVDQQGALTQDTCSAYPVTVLHKVALGRYSQILCRSRGVTCTNVSFVTSTYLYLDFSSTPYLLSV